MLKKETDGLKIKEKLVDCIRFPVNLVVPDSKIEINTNNITLITYLFPGINSY